jgi:DNA polymerase/3'-5' exonuclease PolX
MTLKDLIYAEIDKLDEQNLTELYAVIQNFTQIKSSQTKTGALQKLKQIKIQAPEDFAANLDLYLSGEKQLASDPDLH